MSVVILHVGAAATLKQTVREPRCEDERRNHAPIIISTKGPPGGRGATTGFCYGRARV